MGGVAKAGRLGVITVAMMANQHPQDNLTDNGSNTVHTQMPSRHILLLVDIRRLAKCLLDK